MTNDFNPAIPQHAPKKSRKTLWIILGVIGGLMLLACGGCLALTGITAKKIDDKAKAIAPITALPNTDGGDSSVSGPQRYNVGQTVVFTASDGSVHNVTVTKAVATTKDIVITVVITCTKGKVSYNEFDWKIRDANGVDHSVDIFASVKPKFGSGDLGAGQKVTGSLAFERDGAVIKGVQVVYTPGIEDEAYWVVP